MFRPRIIPTLLLKGDGLVKTVEFKKPVYIGDPINAVHIFNDLKADELVFLDIEATPKKRKVNLELLKRISDEAYMPFAVGGGITELEDVKNCFMAGAEKVIVNTAAIKSPELVTQIAETYGKQSVVVSIDVKKNWKGKYVVCINSGSDKLKTDLFELIKKMEQAGAGELMINSIDRDGKQNGYDIELMKKATDLVNIPVIACGGAGKLDDLRDVIFEGGASAAAAGSLFVYHGARKGVLINYPSNDELLRLFAK